MIVVCNILTRCCVSDVPVFETGTKACFPKLYFVAIEFTFKCLLHLSGVRAVRMNRTPVGFRN